MILIYFSVSDRTSRPKSSKNIENLNNEMNKIDLIDMFRTLYSAITDTVISSAHGTFAQIDYMMCDLKQIPKHLKGFKSHRVWSLTQWN